MSVVWLDRLGGIASTACAVHCVVVAAAPALVSVAGFTVLGHEAAEWVFFALAVSFAGAAAVLGYPRHRTWWVPAGFAAGGLVLLAGRLGEALALHESGVFLAVLGGGLLVTSHVASLRRARVAGEACCP